MWFDHGEFNVYHVEIIQMIDCDAWSGVLFGSNPKKLFSINKLKNHTKAQCLT